jgi:hypothetical protein
MGSLSTKVNEPSYEFQEKKTKPTYTQGDIVRYKKINRRNIPEKKDDMIKCASRFHPSSVPVDGKKKWCKSCRVSYFKNTRKSKGVINEIKEINEPSYAGYIISLKNSEEIISLMIENQPICYEKWGWDCEYEDVCDCERECECCMNGAVIHNIQYEPDFVDMTQRGVTIRLITNLGCIRLNVWCDHNGHYKHLVKSVILGEMTEEYL